MLPIIDINNPEGKKRLEAILSRSQLELPGIQNSVDTIIKNVKRKRDAALLEYAKEFDKAELKAIKVSSAELEKAYNSVDNNLKNIIHKAIARIKDFHMKQKTNSWFETLENGEILGQIVRPVESVGVYVPGGKAAYPSSVIMNVIPAIVAGVKNIFMATPPKQDGNIDALVLFAAMESGVSAIYKAGGAQAIAALAFGTETVPKADKIVGPGNIYTALAKRSVYGYVDIDSVAGPSEILIIADETANPVFIAADMLSQAEHDELASAICITTSKGLAEKIITEAGRQTETLERKNIIRKSLGNYGAVILAGSICEAIGISNKIAPEHLELCISEPFSYLEKIKNAGAIFLGHYTPEPLGDYIAGPNHVLPTGGTARFYSPLSVDDFIKKSSILYFDKNSMKNLSTDVISFANAEGLTAHASSIKVRL